MAAHTISGQRWPDGTTVSVYRAESWPDSAPAPSGTAVTSAVVTAGSVAFSGLLEKVRYVAYAGSLGVRFLVPEHRVDSLRARLEELEGSDPLTDLAVLREAPVNVRYPEFGAVGDGTTDDVGAVQAALTVVATSPNGGEVFVPPGDYLIGAPGLSVPDNLLIGVKFNGAGMGGTKTSSEIVRLVRNGTHPVLAAAGTGVTDGLQVAGLKISNMTWAGNNFAGKLLSLRRCSDVDIENMRLRDAFDYGLYATQAWNWRIRNLVMNTCGDQGLDHPQVFFGDEGDAGSNTNTVDIVQSTFEAGRWHDIVVDGSVAAGNGAYLDITNSKFERAVGYAMVWGRSTGCSLTNSFLHSNGANGVLKCVNGESNNFESNAVDLGPTCTATEALRFEGGITPIVAGNNFIGRPAVALARGIALLSGPMTHAEIYGNTYQGNWTAEVVDNRTAPAGILEVRGRITAFDGMVHKTKAGAPVDGDFLRTPPNGTVVIDTTNSKIYVRIGGTWKATAALT